MRKKVLIGLLLCFLTLQVRAMVCEQDDDCTEWGTHHCICGVRAHCAGLIGQFKICHCFGAHGRCPRHKVDSEPKNIRDVLLQRIEDKPQKTR